MAALLILFMLAAIYYVFAYQINNQQQYEYKMNSQIYEKRLKALGREPYHSILYIQSQFKYNPHMKCNTYECENNQYDSCYVDNSFKHAMNTLNLCKDTKNKPNIGLRHSQSPRHIDHPIQKQTAVAIFYDIVRI